MHEFIRADILNHISQNLHNPIPGSGGNTFDQSISVGVGIETINNVAGSPSTTYSSVERYLQIMSRPYAYDTNIELIAAAATGPAVAGLWVMISPQKNNALSP